jgi:alpha-1,3-rhamnosyl/mannosyltransferase
MVELQPLAWPVENFTYQFPQRYFKTVYRELIWARFVAPALMQQARLDIYHSTGVPLVTPPARIPHVVTLHDLAILRYPHRFRRWQRYSAIRSLEKIRMARRVICISQFTADEAMSLLKLPAGQIDIVHNGCDFNTAGSLPAEQVPGEKLPSDFYLFVGSLEPGKNLALLKETYALAASRGIHLPDLVIMGARWQGVANEGAPPANWHYLGFQPDGVLVHLYRRARALVFPSIYEGFGLPIAEAMSLGCPVICSRVASLPEVAGEAGIYAELMAADYLEKMRELAQNDALRQAKVEAGLIQSRQFTWRRCAEQTLAVYEKAVRS